MIQNTAPADIKKRASQIKYLFIDCDGVLTDNGAFVGPQGEVMKRFSFRDGMGVERLRDLAGIETAIITGENTGVVSARAKKLKINEVHLGISNKLEKAMEIAQRLKLERHEIAYMGDDMNDLEVMKWVSFCACPNDAFKTIRSMAHLVSQHNGGYGAYREMAEWLIEHKNGESQL